MIHATPGEFHLESAQGLRRVPRQQRSKDRVLAILDATSELLEETSYDDLTTTLIAERAGMSVSSLYQFFANVDAIVVELVRVWTRQFDQIVSAAAEGPLTDWVDAMIDGYVEYFRSTPGFRAVYFNGALRGEARSLDRASNTMLEQQFAQLWSSRLGRPASDFRTPARITVHIGDALLELAFRLSPTGDPGTIAEAKHVLRLYLGDALDAEV